MGHVALAHPEKLGWARDLTGAQQQKLGVKVAFWQRENEHAKGTLLAPFST